MTRARFWFAFFSPALRYVNVGGMSRTGMIHKSQLMHKGPLKTGLQFALYFRARFVEA